MKRLQTRSGMTVYFKMIFGELRKKCFPARMRRGRALAVTALVISLGWGHRAQAAGLKSISVVEYRAQITRLQGLVAACSTTAVACDASRVGDDMYVGDEAKGGFEQHWQWLRAALTKAKTAKAEERATLLYETEGQIAELSRESGDAGSAGQVQEFRRARKEANAVLARGEFQLSGGPTWWQRLMAWAVRWVGRFFNGIAEVGIAAPWLGKLLAWLFFVGAAAGLLFFLLRHVARQRLRISLSEGVRRDSAWGHEADDWAERAERYAAADEWREAVHCLYWAAIVLLETRRAWRRNPTRTPREYVRLLKAGSAQEQGLRGLTQIFERVWYGLREANAEEYAEARAIYERLMVSSAEGEGSRGGIVSAVGAA